MDIKPEHYQCYAAIKVALEKYFTDTLLIKKCALEICIMLDEEDLESVS